MKRHELSEEGWNKIKDLLLPEKKPQGGRSGKSNRQMLNAILYWLNTAIYYGEIYQNVLVCGKAYIVDLEHGHKRGYGKSIVWTNR